MKITQAKTVLDIHRPVFKFSRRLYFPTSRFYPSWSKILRRDPCAYCGGPGGTVDHIRARSTDEAIRFHGLNGMNAWMNMTGACPTCNNRKQCTPMLQFLLQRSAA